MAALAALRAIERVGKSVPDNVALVCFDLPEWGETFGLTMVHPPFSRLGRLAVDRLLSRLADPDAPTDVAVAQAVIHHRTSCGCPAAQRDRTETGVSGHAGRLLEPERARQPVGCGASTSAS
jgi:LacI family transcriptional regulator